VPQSSERLIALPPDVALHARPAAEFVKLAMGFGAEIELINGEREADGKSLMAVLALGATGGTELLLRARGGDASGAVEALAGYVAQLH
jgi:phosphotransferase system HPr (HPr) family protein